MSWATVNVVERGRLTLVLVHVGGCQLRGVVVTQLWKVNGGFWGFLGVYWGFIEGLTEGLLRG